MWRPMWLLWETLRCTAELINACCQLANYLQTSASSWPGQSMVVNSNLLTAITSEKVQFKVIMGDAGRWSSGHNVACPCLRLASSLTCRKLIGCRLPVTLLWQYIVRIYIEFFPFFLTLSPWDYFNSFWWVNSHPNHLVPPKIEKNWTFTILYTLSWS